MKEIHYNWNPNQNIPSIQGKSQLPRIPRNKSWKRPKLKGNSRKEIAKISREISEKREKKKTILQNSQANPSFSRKHAATSFSQLNHRQGRENRRKNDRKNEGSNTLNKRVHRGSCVEKFRDGAIDEITWMAKLASTKRLLGAGSAPLHGEWGGGGRKLRRDDINTGSLRVTHGLISWKSIRGIMSGSGTPSLRNCPSTSVQTKRRRLWILGCSARQSGCEENAKHFAPGIHRSIILSSGWFSAGSRTDFESASKENLEEYIFSIKSLARVENFSVLNCSILVYLDILQLYLFKYSVLQHFSIFRYAKVIFI